MSSYWRPLASLCTLPLPGTPGRAGAAADFCASASGVVVALVVVVVDCPDSVLVFVVLSLQAPSTNASARARARDCLDMRHSFSSGTRGSVWSGLGAQAGTSHGLPHDAAG